MSYVCAARPFYYGYVYVCVPIYRASLLCLFIAFFPYMQPLPYRWAQNTPYTRKERAIGPKAAP